MTKIIESKTGNDKIDILTYASRNERTRRTDFIEEFENSPIPREELLSNLGLYMNRQTLSRIMFMHELYQRVIPVHGVVMEFGVRWGQNLSLFSAFRGMYEPYNHTRKLVGFDTFNGFPLISEKDGNSPILKVGAYSTSTGYESHLEKVMAYQESESPLSHIKKYELCKGDATHTLEQYLKDHPETIVALAYFDMDLYEPTKKCLEQLKPHLTKGSVLGFDELCNPDYPGETAALNDVFGIGRYAIQRSTLTSMPSFVVIE